MQKKETKNIKKTKTKKESMNIKVLLKENGKTKEEQKKYF